MSLMRNYPFSLGKGFASRLVQRLGLAPFNVNGIWLELNPSAWIDRALLSGEEHDAFVYRSILEGMAQGGTFVDVGANIGVFTLAAAKMPGVEVYAFEPSPRELTRLYRNLAINRVHNVIVFPMALGATFARLNLSIFPPSNPGSNSLVPEESSPAVETVSCHCDALDSLLTPHIARQVKVVKMDVEGFEMEALKGMSNLVSELRGAIFLVEVTRSALLRAGSSPEEMYAFFSERGYQPTVGVQDCDIWNEKFSRQDRP